MSAYIDEPYQDEYQSQEAEKLDYEADFQEGLLRNEPADCFVALLDYFKSDEFSEGEASDLLYDMVKAYLNCKFENRHTPFNQIVNSAIEWQAKQNAIKILK
jgi:hypothetical protein